jgi:orotidine-5'-phosphate decarboxylase
LCRKVDFMPELIVALDGPDPLDLAVRLRRESAVRWFKISELTLFRETLARFYHFANAAGDARFFLDFKLAHPRFTCAEIARRVADCPHVAALSCATPAATEAAVGAAAGSALRIWQVVGLTDNGQGQLVHRMPGAHGVICPGYHAPLYNEAGIDVVTPGVRIPPFPADSHKWVTAPQQCHEQGITHAVVGRPIWQAGNPVAAARSFLAALRCAKLEASDSAPMQSEPAEET